LETATVQAQRHPGGQIAAATNQDQAHGLKAQGQAAQATVHLLEFRHLQNNQVVT